jgi:hypothetical protein
VLESRSELGRELPVRDEHHSNHGCKGSVARSSGAAILCTAKGSARPMRRIAHASVTTVSSCPHREAAIRAKDGSP